MNIASDYLALPVPGELTRVLLREIPRLEVTTLGTGPLHYHTDGFAAPRCFAKNAAWSSLTVGFEYTSKCEQSTCTDRKASIATTIARPLYCKHHACIAFFELQ